MPFLKKNNAAGKCILLLSIFLLLTGLYRYGHGSSEAAESADVPSEPQIRITDADVTTDADGAEVILLEEENQICRIERAGKYLLRGEFRGSVEVDVQDQIVHLILGGVDIESDSGPACNIVSAGKVIITLQEGTTNNFRDTGSYPRGIEADACIYSVCDLTFNGPGALNVSGYFKDAIHTKDTMKILDGTIYVQSKRDGLHGNDGIVIASQSLRAESERHGLNSTKSGKPGKGNIEILRGENSVIGGGYAISCAADLYAAQCTLHATGILDTFHVLGNTSVPEGVLD